MKFWFCFLRIFVVRTGVGAPPSVLKSKFVDDGTGILVSFETETNG